jgi:hypothetical protein
MSKPSGQAAGTARQSLVSGGAVRPARWVRARGLRRRRRVAWLAVVSGGTVVLAIPHGYAAAADKSIPINSSERSTDVR